MQKILGQVKVDLPYQEWNFHPNMLENLWQKNLQQQHIRLENLVLENLQQQHLVLENLVLENLMQLNLWLLDFKQLNLVLNFKVLNLHIPYRCTALLP